MKFQFYIHDHPIYDAINNSWEDNASHINIGINTPLCPVWDYPANTYQLSKMLDPGDYKSPVANYLFMKTHGSSIRVRLTTNCGYTESGNEAIGGQNTSYMKNWILGIRATDNFEDYDTRLPTYSAFKGLASFNSVSRTKQGRDTVYGSAYAKTRNVMQRKSANFNAHENIVVPYQSGTIGIQDNVSHTTDFTQTTMLQPVHTCCWQIYYKPDVTVYYADANLNSPPAIMEVDVTYYVEFYRPNKIDSIQTNSSAYNPTIYGTPTGLLISNSIGYNGPAFQAFVPPS